MHFTLQQAGGGWTNRQIHDTVAAIARQRAFAPARQSIVGRIVRYVFERIADAINLIHGSPDVRRLAILAMIAVAVVVVGRVVVTRRVDAERTMRRHGARLGASGPEAWAAARELASAGDYTGACHALYAAVLHALARDGALKRHASKTSGDYVRELRLRGSPAVRGFREFAGDFDHVIYGRGIADADDFARLASAAERAVRIAPAA
jgi:Domain of unknown function (DUF4129)